MIQKENTYINPGGAVPAFMISPVTVRQWTHRGELTAMITAGGHRRFSPDDVNKVIKANSGEPGAREHDELRVLIVDDDEQTSRYLQELIASRDESIEVISAKDGFEAGLHMYQFLPHIVLLDLMMPEIDGYRVCKQIKTGHMIKDIRVIAMTGFYSEENATRILEAGAETCLQKPFTPEALFRVMRLDRDD